MEEFNSNFNFKSKTRHPWLSKLTSKFMSIALVFIAIVAF